MDNQVLKFLETKCSKEPVFIDKLFVSAFLIMNNLVIKKNELIKAHLITQENKTEYLLLEQFIKIINKQTHNFSFELLIELYEFVISPADKVVNGAVYTPVFIRQFIVNKLLNNENIDLSHSKIGDISCGCGGFLFNAAKKIKESTYLSFFDIYKNNIFGLDIQEYSIVRTKLLLTLLAISEGEDKESFDFNLFHGDALSFSFKRSIPNFEGFNYIIGNPPYVCSRHLNEETKMLLKKWTVCETGHPDLYIPFFQISLENLSPQGWLGYITMNSFFKSLNGRALRKYITDRRFLLRIIDFGSEQIFRSKNTYTCICFIQNNFQQYIEYSKNESCRLNDNLNFHRIDYDNLNSEKGWNLNNHYIISKIESVGKPLGEKYKSRHGIATLKNNLYIFKPIKEDNEFYYLENGSIHPIEKEICRDIVNSNKLSRNVQLSEIMEKVIFPYDNSNKPKLLNEDVLQGKYPCAYKYLSLNKDKLALRDKGKKEYQQWYAFGRTQSLEKIKHKLLFPKMTNKTPSCIIYSDENLLFYNGQAVIGSSEKELIIIKRIMESRLFWYYIKSTSKPYSSDYYSLNGNYIKNFGISDFNKEEEELLLYETDKHLIDNFLERKYDIKFD